LIYYSHRPDFRVKTIIEIGTLWWLEIMDLVSTKIQVNLKCY
jgi:hypothetical protein